MNILIITLLVVAAVVLLLIELFLIPGTSLAAFIAGGCLLYAIYFAFINLGLLGGLVTLVVSIILCTLSVVWFMKSKTLEKISLKKSIEGSVDREAEKTIAVGDKGMTTTRLAQIGFAEINGKIVEVKSAGDFINPKTPIRVIRIANGNILVEIDQN